MKWPLAILLITAALVAGGVWSGMGERLVPSGPEEGSRLELVEATPDTAAADALPATEEATDGEAQGEGEGEPTDAATDPPPFEGYDPVEFRTDEPVQHFDASESVLEPGLDYRAVLETTAGTIHVDLYDDRVPRTVNNFVFLALHRFYEDVPFHRVLEDFMAQTGDPTGTGSGGPGYTFEDEIVPELEHDRPGLLSMANAGPNTNGSQFFITFAAAPWLDGNHAVFGEVTNGMDTLDALTRIDPQTPTALARLSDPVSVLAEGGVTALAGMEGTVRSWLEGELGTLPVQGQSFQIDGRRGVLGSVSGAPAVGLFPVPDRILSVTVYTAPEEDPS